jgi:hypothetical protein
MGQSPMLPSTPDASSGGGFGSGGDGGGGGLPGPLGQLFGSGALGKVPGGNPLAGVLGGGGGGGDSGGGSDSSTGSPVYLTDPNAVASKAGAEAQKGAEELGKNIQQTGQAADTQVQTSTTELTGTAGHHSVCWQPRLRYASSSCRGHRRGYPDRNRYLDDGEKVKWPSPF